MATVTRRSRPTPCDRARTDRSPPRCTGTSSPTARPGPTAGRCPTSSDGSSDGDPWSAISKHAQTLGQARRRLASALAEVYRASLVAALPLVLDGRRRRAEAVRPRPPRSTPPRAAPRLRRRARARPSRFSGASASIRPGAFLDLLAGRLAPPGRLPRPGCVCARACPLGVLRPARGAAGRPRFAGAGPLAAMLDAGLASAVAVRASSRRAAARLAFGAAARRRRASSRSSGSEVIGAGDRARHRVSAIDGQRRVRRGPLREHADRRVNGHAGESQRRRDCGARDGADVHACSLGSIRAARSSWARASRSSSIARSVAASRPSSA